MASDESKRVILGTPYVFVRNRPDKPAHLEVVTQQHRPVLCHNGCGVYYIPPADKMFAWLGPARCPDCDHDPKPWRIGMVEEIDIAVHMAFGNRIDLRFLQARGRVTTRVIGFFATSLGAVSDAA